jgi:DNA-binding CsgD family transcriptional regulator
VGAIDEPSASTAGRRTMEPGDSAYLLAIGQVARSIGAADFHEKLLGLFSSVIAHDTAWIVRYTRDAPVDVLYTKGVANHLVDYYRERAYYRTDPFFWCWHAHQRSGVMTLCEACAQAEHEDFDREFYRVVFLRKAQFSDEMGMFLPTLGKSCIALFIERKAGQYSSAEAAVARQVFPAIEGLHRAHIANLFSSLRDGGTDESRKMLRFPTLIVDRAGASIYASPEWRKWERSDRSLKAARQKLDAGSVTSQRLDGTSILRVERFARDFQLAPGGRMFVITERPAGDAPEAARLRAASDLEKLSRRERQIVALLVIGCTLGEIAQRLQIGKGTIKNYRLSLYRKLGISSERTLISRFWPLVEDFRKDPMA